MKMTKHWDRRRHEIEEAEKSILHHPPPGDQGWNFDEQRTYLNDLSNTKRKSSIGSLGRCSPVSVMSESSETKTIVSQSYTSRSLSSASSWTDDVYEEETARKVQQLFDAIDSLLYEGIELPIECKDLHGECNYWIHSFPHLRINGTKLHTENEQINEQISGFSNAPASTFMQNLINDNPTVVCKDHKRTISGKSEEALSSLVVQGMSLEPLIISAIDDNVSDTSNVMNSSYEEIIDQHGIYEELIAADFSEEKQQDQLTDEIEAWTDIEIQLQQQIMKRLIKDIWNETISCLRPLLVKYISVVLQGAEYKTSDHGKGKLPNNNTIGDSPPTRLPTAPMTNQGFVDLQGLLTISSKTLLNRNFDKNIRSITQTSAPPAMVGARLSSPPRGLNKSSRGRLAPLEHSVRVSIPASRMGLVLQDNWKAPIAQAPPPVSPHAWGRHFPLPPIESALQATSRTKVSSKLKPTSSAVIRMLSGSLNKRGASWDSTKIRPNANNHSTVPTSLTNTRTSRLLSAQIDSMRSYPVSYAAVGERIKSGSKLKDFRVQLETLNKARGGNETQKERLPSGYLHNNIERRNTNR